MLTTRDRKARVTELLTELQRSTSPEGAWVKELFGLQLEEAKDSLISAVGENTLRLQGEAQALNKLLIGVTRPAPQMQQRREQV